MSWRHFPKVVELVGSSGDQSVGEEFRRRRELRRQEQLELKRVGYRSRRKAVRDRPR